MESETRQTEKVTPMFSNVFKYDDDIMFEKVQKGVVELKFAHKKLFQGSHVLKCKQLCIGLHWISDLVEFEEMINLGVVQSEFKEEEVENIGVVVR